MQDIFKTVFYEKVVEKQNDYWLIGGGLILVVAILTKNKSIFVVVLICLLAIIIFKGIKSYFEYEILETQGEGDLKIDSDTICFNDTSINWQDVKVILFHRIDYEGRRITENKGRNQYRLSIGVGNTITVETHQGDKSEYHFKINSLDEFQFLENFVWDLVESKSFALDIAKGIVTPKNYQEHQKLKSILNKNNKP